MYIRSAILSIIAVAAFASGARAQWDAPSFLAPRPTDDIGIYVVDMDGADLGIEGIWRQSGNLNLGVRVGYLDTAGDGRLVAGGETWGALLSAGPDFPVDVSWTLGAGALIGDGVIFSVPVGLTIGRALVLTPVSFQVYGHPRLALVASSAGDVAGDDDTNLDVEAMFDIGADVYVSEDLTARLGFTLGGPDALGIGLAYRWGRGIEVR